MKVAPIETGAASSLSTVKYPSTEEFALTEAHISSLSAAVKAIRITPFIGESDKPLIVDGGSTTLTLDGYVATAELHWSNDPPQEWVGVEELCEAIEDVYASVIPRKGSLGNP